MAKMRFGGEPGKRPSEVFARRLAETRKARGFSQQALSNRMGELGRPLGKAAILGIENGTRNVSLDETIALAQALNASPANLLSPTDDELVSLTDAVAVDGGGMRRWLATGMPLVARPAQMKTSEDRQLLGAWLERQLVGLAVALTDAARAGDQPGITAAAEQIITEVSDYREAAMEVERNG